MTPLCPCCGSGETIKGWGPDCAAHLRDRMTCLNCACDWSESRRRPASGEVGEPVAVGFMTVAEADNEYGKAARWTVTEGCMDLPIGEHTLYARSLPGDAVDAARYRWLCDFREWPDDVAAAIDCGPKVAIDDAIDAAIKAGSV